MVDLARQAFETNNFVLAAEIYERYIAENGPNVDVVLGLADSYAGAKLLRKAFDAYIQALRLGNVSSSRLDNLVTALLDIMASENGFEASKSKKIEDPFTCGLCGAMWDDPVTIQCGHSYCRPCLTKLNGKKCKVCGVVTRYSKIHTIRTNVLLAQTIESWFPEELLAVKLKAQGNAYFAKSEFAKAIQLYSEAFGKVKSDHILASNRSLAYASLEKYSEALKDAERCISIRPEWPKGYFRKGEALVGHSRYDEACLCYLKCLSIDPTITAARTALTRSLQKVLTPKYPEDVKQAEMHLLLHPNPLLLLQKFQPETESAASCALANNVETIKNTRTGFNQLSSTVHLDSSTSHVHAEQSDGQSDRPIVKCTPLQMTLHKCAKFGWSSFSGLGGDVWKSIRRKKKKNKKRRKKIGSSEPCLNKQKNCEESQLEMPGCSQLKCCQSCDKLSRKRTNTNRVESYVSPPNSPVKRMPSLQSYQSVMQEEKSPAERMLEAEKPASAVRRPVAANKLSVDNFECSLCMRLICEGVTTPCGHTFCRVCLDRSLDHTPSCPLCKSSLAEYLAERRSLATEAISEILRIYFPREYAERKQLHEEELLEFHSGEEIPVFVCTVAYPKIPCPLHVFEPQYRLMIRQCMESGFRQFGMAICLEDNEDNYADYGTMLEIRDVQYFPDGRSVVDCIGGRRFKVKSRGHRHGYHTAKVDFITDQSLTPEQMQETSKVHGETHALAKQWFESLPAPKQTRIVSHFGALPSVEQGALGLASGPAWHWWLIAVLPLEPRAQLTLLAMTSLRERLLAIQRVISYMGRRSLQSV